MAGKKHKIGRFMPQWERIQHGINYTHRSCETLCGLLFRSDDRNPFAATEEDVTCQWCQRIMNKQEVNFTPKHILKNRE
jgi:hypothetical protein